MITTRSKSDVKFEQPLVLYERLLVGLHELIASDAGDSPEADALREQMDRPWVKLSAQHAELLGGLSADLYMLSGDEIREPAEGVESSAQLDLLRAKAHQRRRWREFLQLMRRGPTSLTTAMVAYVRARAYEHLGLKKAAAKFMDYAATLEPKDTYRALAMELLREAGDLSGAVTRANAILADKDSSARSLIMAAGVLFASTREMGPEAARQVYESVRAAIDHSLRKQAGPVDAELGVPALVMKGLVFEFIGDLDNARAAFTQAEALAPFDLLVREATAGIPLGVVEDGRRRMKRLRLVERIQESLVAA